jgi:hypothetical protein
MPVTVDGLMQEPKDIACLACFGQYMLLSVVTVVIIGPSACLFIYHNWMSHPKGLYEVISVSINEHIS